MLHPLLIAQKLNAPNEHEKIRSYPALRPAWVNSQAQSFEPTLIILAYFPDTDRNLFTETTQEEWRQRFFGSKPSITDYFEKISFGRMGLRPAGDTDGEPNNGVVGWYQLLNNFAHYKQQYGDEYFVHMAKEAVVSARNDLDFAQYDVNRDGLIASHELHIYVIVAAFDLQYSVHGTPDDPKVHRVRFPFVAGSRNIPVNVDGVQIGVHSVGGGVCFGGELLFKYESGIFGRKHSQNRTATLAHELGHDFGLPDHYYEPDHAGTWCIMGTDIVADLDYPNAPCAPHRMQLQWVTPQIITSDQSGFLTQINTSARSYLLPENGVLGREYFHVENRYKQLAGEYDSQTPGSGALIWHVDSTRMLADDTQGLALERARNGDEAFHGGGNANFLATGSSPNSRSNQGYITGISISNIGAAGPIIAAELAVTHQPLAIALSANPQVLLANGMSTALVSASVVDRWNEAVHWANNTVTFALRSGANAGTLVGNNPAPAVAGRAAINFRASTSPGLATIEATSVGLAAGQANINVFQTSTLVGGPITVNTTWDLARSPFEATSDVTVHNGATLAIEPGVIVLFRSGTQLRISSSTSAGTLIANGTQAQPILFTSVNGDNNAWEGILFDDRSSDGPTSSMTWCRVEKAGEANSRGANADMHCVNTNTPTMSNCTIGQPLSYEHAGYALLLEGASPSISHTTFYNSGAKEVVRLASGSGPRFTNCTFTGSGSAYWLFAVAGDCNPNLTSCAFDGAVDKAVRVGTVIQMSGNTFQGATASEIEIIGGDLTGTLTLRKQEGGLVYAVIMNNYRVYYGGKLTVEPGITMKFASGTGLIIAGDDIGRANGALSANGTATDSIYFTSLSGIAGNWKGILFDDDSDYGATSSLQYCIVEKAGEVNTRGSNAAIHCRSTVMPDISQITVRNTTGAVIQLTSSSISVSHSVFYHNAPVEAVRLSSNSNPSFINCNFISNGSTYWMFADSYDGNPAILSCNFRGSVSHALRLGTGFQMSGNTFQGAAQPEIEIIGGDLTGTRILRKQEGGSIYAVIMNNYRVYYGGKLTIEPGVTMKFASGTGLIIAGDDIGRANGALSASGTPADSIYFTSLSGIAGNWQGILFDDDSDYGATSALNYCVIEKAGEINARGSNAAIHCRATTMPDISQITVRNTTGAVMQLTSASISVSHSVFYHNAPVEALRLGGDSNPSFTNCNFISNGSTYWMFADSYDGNPIILSCSFRGMVDKALRLGTTFQMSGNTFQGATAPEIEIIGGDLTGAMILRKQQGGSVYAVIMTNYRVYYGGRLTIEPGVTLKFASGTGLIIAGDDIGRANGALSASGTSTDPIIFTSLTSQVANWQGLLFDDDSDYGTTSLLQYCVVEKAGEVNARGASAAVYCRSTTTPVINHTLIRNNGGYGLFANVSSPRITNSAIFGNALSGVYLIGASSPVIGNAYGTSNDIHGNAGLYDLENAGTSNVNARYNYWGTTSSAQIAARIFDKADNPNNGQVFYEPWTDTSHVSVLPDNTPPSNPAYIAGWSDDTRSLLIYDRVPYEYVNPHFAWGGVRDLSGLLGYAMLFTLDSTQTPFVLQRDSSFTVRQPLQANRTYYLRMRAQDNARNWSNTTTLFVYRYQPSGNHAPSTPTALLPASGAELKPEGLLLWTEAVDADMGDVITYALQIDEDSTFASPEVNQAGLGGALPVPSLLARSDDALAVANAVAVRLDTLRGFNNLVDNRVYYWRVRAQDQYGGASPFTTTRVNFFFNKTNTAPGAVTTGFSPREGLEVRLSRPELSWHPASDPDLSDHGATLRYNVQLHTSADFSSPRYSYRTALGLATLQVPDSLTENAQWYWRVQTLDDEDLVSNWSAAQDFWVNAIDEPPAPFALLAPANGASTSGDSVYFRWETTSDPDPRDRFFFVFETARDSLFNESLVTADSLVSNHYAVFAKSIRG
ncbi:hypothetical protein HUU05_00775, partial [candidate division KSB1 bacterium]|nr:hypothetical protein [candidate division KSB1 bacterium]